MIPFNQISTNGKMFLQLFHSGELLAPTSSYIGESIFAYKILEMDLQGQRVHVLTFLLGCAWILNL